MEWRGKTAQPTGQSPGPWGCLRASSAGGEHLSWPQAWRGEGGGWFRGRRLALTFLTWPLLIPKPPDPWNSISSVRVALLLRIRTPLAIPYLSKARGRARTGTPGTGSEQTTTCLATLGCRPATGTGFSCPLYQQRNGSPEVKQPGFPGLWTLPLRQSGRQAARCPGQTSSLPRLKLSWAKAIRPSANLPKTGYSSIHLGSYISSSFYSLGYFKTNLSEDLSAYRYCFSIVAVMLKFCLPRSTWRTF